MSQNTSHAVMAQRVEPHDSLEDFPTPPWATRALIEKVLRDQMEIDVSGLRCWEPACNRGFMARPLTEYFADVSCTDVHDYGFGHGKVDFLFKNYPDPMSGAFDWVVTNPPFRLAQQFVDRSGEVATMGFAMIVRTGFLESVGRYDGLFKRNPPSMIAQFTERVPMFKGRLDAKGSTATAYCWLVWVEEEAETRFCWIPPCRRSLERPGDYFSDSDKPENG